MKYKNLKNIFDIINDKDYRIIAFDFFDTLAIRDCSPEETLYEWAKQISVLIGFEISPSIIYRVRKDVELKLKKIGNTEEPTYNQLIENTFYELFPQIDSEEKRRKFLNESRIIEEKIECGHISIKKETIDFVRKLSENHRLIIVSDFYMDSSIFWKILKKNSIDICFEKIFVSSELGIRKSTGNLYKYVLGNLEITSDSLIMLGDNARSDYEVPKSIGIGAIKIEAKYPNRRKDEQYIQNIYKELMNYEENNPLSGYLPEIAYFISRLHVELTKHSAKNVLFCSREGQLIKQLFDTYEEIFFPNQRINSSYFYVSRKATLLPSLKQFEVENFDSIFRQFDKLKVEDFLNNLGFSIEEANKVCQEAIVNKTDYISSNENDKIKKKLSDSTFFIAKYDEKRKCQRGLFYQYIEQLGFNVANDIITIVDIGWKGTIQDNISNCLPEGVVVEGFYLGLRLMEYNIKNKERKQGIIFSDYPNKSANFELLNRGAMFWERIFSADHGPVVGYEAVQNMVSPKIDSKEELALHQFMKPYQDAMAKSFEKLMQAYRSVRWLPYEREDLLHKSVLKRQCIFSPKIWKIEKRARELSKENFGDISKNTMKRKERFGKEQLKKKDFLFVDYSYRLLEKYHLKVLFPLADLYCRLIYLIKRIEYERKIS